MQFVELVTKQNKKELNRLMRSSSKELVQAKERIKKLDSIMQRLYEDNIDGKISDDRFFRMSATYETEQKQLEARVSELEAAIAEAREQRLNVNSFLGMVLRYTDITELTAEIIRSFVEKIEVKKPEKVPGTRAKKADLGHLVELYRRGRYPTTRVRRNGIAYMIVSYAVSFLSILRP